MDILIDFDNIDYQMRQAGIRSVCTRVIQGIVGKRGEMPEHCRFRLYGGWYDGDQMTKGAQSLSTEIQAEFPNVIRWSGRRVTGNCIADVELACSLAVDPGRKLTHTFRVRRFEDKVRCDTMLLAKCNHDPCLVRAIGQFFTNKKCANPRCYMTPGDLLSKEEQKMVDTMLTADLIYLATHGERDLAVVSSDDDLWPGIQTALLSGARVVHLHTREQQRTRPNYSTGLMEYRESAL
jgi:hypothetical protein